MGPAPAVAACSTGTASTLLAAKRMELSRRKVCLVTDSALWREVRESASGPRTGPAEERAAPQPCAHQRSSRQSITYQPWKKFYFIVFRMRQSTLAHVRFRLSPGADPAAWCFTQAEW